MQYNKLCQARPCEDLLLLQRRGLFASAARPCHRREALSMMCIYKHLNYSIAKHLLWILRNSCNDISSLRVSLRFLIYFNSFAVVCIFNNLLLFYFQALVLLKDSLFVPYCIQSQLILSSTEMPICFSCLWWWWQALGFYTQLSIAS